MYKLSNEFHANNNIYFKTIESCWQCDKSMYAGALLFVGREHCHSRNEWEWHSRIEKGTQNDWYVLQKGNAKWQYKTMSSTVMWVWLNCQQNQTRKSGNKWEMSGMSRQRVVCVSFKGFFIVIEWIENVNRIVPFTHRRRRRRSLQVYALFCLCSLSIVAGWSVPFEIYLVFKIDVL